MNRNLLLALGVTVLTLMVALGLIRHLAPGLLGGPTDLQLVQVDERLPPFFEGVFRKAHADREFLLKDPLTRIRARPFYPPELAFGPHDVLGFRNAAVPVTADIVTIGDSMTYGNNAPLHENWPGWMQAVLGRPEVTIYNMSTGGWAAVQYLDMLGYAAVFNPYVVVVAFYTGNDPIESLQLVNGSEHWRWLKEYAGVDADVTTEGLPEFSVDIPPEEQWPVTFDDGTATVFTPRLRLISNTDHPGVDAGYQLMAAAAGLIGDLARQSDIRVVFTVIPTKELVYAKKVTAQGLDSPEPYRELVTAETGRLRKLAAELQAVEGARYVDVVGPLQTAALGATPLYPDDMSGHPLPAGYRVIGESIAPALADAVPAPPRGLYALGGGNDGQHLVLVTGEGLWYFKSQLLAGQNGWEGHAIGSLDPRQVFRIPVMGVIEGIDPQRFGPACCGG